MGRVNRKLFEECVKVVAAGGAVTVIGYFSTDMEFPYLRGEGGDRVQDLAGGRYPPSGFAQVRWCWWLVRVVQ